MHLYLAGSAEQGIAYKDNRSLLLLWPKQDTEATWKLCTDIALSHINILTVLKKKMQTTRATVAAQTFQNVFFSVLQMEFFQPISLSVHQA
jgi:hypothetical protein